MTLCCMTVDFVCPQKFTFCHTQFSTFVFSMKIAESEKMVLVSYIIDFNDWLQKIRLRLYSLNLNACKFMKAFLIFSGQIDKKTITILQALRFKLNRLHQICISSKSMMQLTKTIFPDSAIFLEKKSVENRVWQKKNFCGNFFYLYVPDPLDTSGSPQWKRSQGSSAAVHTIGHSTYLTKLSTHITQETADNSRHQQWAGEGRPTFSIPGCWAGQASRDMKGSAACHLAYFNTRYCRFVFVITCDHVQYVVYYCVILHYSHIPYFIASL